MHFIFLKSKWCSAGRGWDVTSSFIPQLGVYNNCSIKGLNSSPNDNFYSSVNWDTWLNNWVLCSLGGADFLLAKLWCMTFVVDMTGWCGTLVRSPAFLFRRPAHRKCSFLDGWWTLHRRGVSPLFAPAVYSQKYAVFGRLICKLLPAHAMLVFKRGRGELLVSLSLVLLMRCCLWLI